MHAHSAAFRHAKFVIPAAASQTREGRDMRRLASQVRVGLHEPVRLISPAAKGDLADRRKDLGPEGL